MGSFREFIANHRWLIQRVARAVDFADPVAFDPADFGEDLLRAAVSRPAQAIDGVLLHSWAPRGVAAADAFELGLRLYEIEGLRFVAVASQFTYEVSDTVANFFLADRSQYEALHALALRLRSPAEPPVLAAGHAETLWKNTIGFLDGDNLARIRQLGGRSRRGVLLSGPPGNGKTTACRWIWSECQRRGWEWRLVTPDVYRAARSNETVESLFAVRERGVIFFDDMDLALRDRATHGENEDQSIFLTAMDGIKSQGGVVFVFTSNCALRTIDAAFKRPGRIDVVLDLRAPDASLRLRLVALWHPQVRAGVDVETVVGSTAGYSFAEIEEIRNLLVMEFVESGVWDWRKARTQFEANRNFSASQARTIAGFRIDPAHAAMCVEDAPGVSADAKDRP